MPVEHAREEMMNLIRDGRGALVRIEAIAFVDFGSSGPDDFPRFWMELMRVLEGLNERIALASAILLTMQYRQ
jgi:hypothetical protein